MKTCLVAAIVLTAIAAAAQAAPASPCPAFFPEKGKTGAMRHAFLRPSVLNVDHDGREYDLAPDDEQKSGTHVEQTWQLDSYRDLPLVIRCHYRGTDKTVTKPAAAELHQCRFRFVLDRSAAIAGRSEFSCQSSR